MHTHSITLTTTSVELIAVKVPLLSPSTLSFYQNWLMCIIMEFVWFNCWPGTLLSFGSNYWPDSLLLFGSNS